MTKIITQNQRDRVLRLLYRTTLRKGEVIIDNMDSTIADELNIHIREVRHIINKDNIERRKNIGIKEEPIQHLILEASKAIINLEVEYTTVKH
jgi:NADH:ubiquinone oxidoreductase subunit E